MTQPVPVLAPDGTPGTVQTTEEAKQIVQEGGKVLSAQEYATTKRAIDLDVKFGSGLAAVEGQVAPLLAGAARGATLGASDYIATKLGGESARQRLLDYKEYQPGASIVGEGIGIVGSALLTGGTSGVAGLGLGAERVAAAALGGGRLARAGGILARGAAEGAVYGAGSALSEGALAGTDITAESLIGGAKHGALGGALASGLLHGAGAAFGRLRRPAAESIDSLASRSMGEEAAGVGKVLRGDSGLVEKYARATGGEKKKILGEIWRNREVALNNSAERIEKLERSFADAINKQQRAASITDAATFGDAKANHIAKLVDRTPEAFERQAVLAREWMTQASDRVNQLARDTAVTKLSPRHVDELAGRFQRVQTAIESGDSAALHQALDHTKQSLGRFAKRGGTEASEAFRELYQGNTAEKGLMSVLEDQAWGKAGAAQKAVNSATKEWISKGARFESGFTTKVAEDGFDAVYGADTNKISGFIGKLTKPANDLDANAVSEMIASRRAFLDATESSYNHGAKAAQSIAQERAALDALEGAFGTATKEASLINQVKRIRGEEQAGAVGGALGLVLDTATKPLATMTRLAQIEGHVSGVLNRVRGGARNLVGVESSAAGASSGDGFFSALMGSVGDDTARGASRFVGSESSRRDFERRSSAIAKLQASPALLTEKTGAALGEFGEAAPKVTAAAAGVATRGLAFLASKLPPSRQDPFSLTPHLSVSTGTLASDTEIAQHMRYQAAIDDPSLVFDLAATGRLTPDHVEAVKAVYPVLYEQMRKDVFEGLTEAKSPVPYGKRIQLGILLDLPTDATLAPDFARAIQDLYVAPDDAANAPRPQSPPSNEVSSSMETPTQSVAKGI